MKVLETIHQFRGYWSGGGVCRIELYTADGLPPLIVATELPENENTSITNLAEYVAAEVVERYLTADQLAGHDPPFIWVEHYPPTQAYGRRGRDERWDLVTFAHYRRERTMANAPRGGWRYALGEADWCHLGREGFEALLAPYVAPERP